MYVLHNLFDFYVKYKYLLHILSTKTKKSKALFVVINCEQIKKSILER